MISQCFTWNLGHTTNSETQDTRQLLPKEQTWKCWCFMMMFQSWAHHEIQSHCLISWISSFPAVLVSFCKLDTKCGHLGRGHFNWDVTSISRQFWVCFLISSWCGSTQPTTSSGILGRLSWTVWDSRLTRPWGTQQWASFLHVLHFTSWLSSQPDFPRW